MNRAERRAFATRAVKMGHFYDRNGCPRCGERSSNTPVIRTSSGAEFMACGTCVRPSDTVTALGVVIQEK